MPDLSNVLQGHDLGFFNIVANGWGIELNAPDAYTAQSHLEAAMRERALLEETVEVLPPEAQQALRALLANEGRMPWTQFERLHGEIRTMGPARRDRERPDLEPASPAERLWYRALIGRAFLNVLPEPQEYCYIPEDLINIFPSLGDSELAPLGRPASPQESAHCMPASDEILDHACTLLAALRCNMDLDSLDVSGWYMPLEALLKLLQSANLVSQDRQVDTEAAGEFLKESRAQALSRLAAAWLGSRKVNELRLLPGLEFNGTWRNKPLVARQAAMEMLSQLPQELWWSLPAFISAVHARQPDFQRSGGDYDAWYIRQSASGADLRGFGAWMEIDGALLRFLISGPLHWLGIFDLASAGPGEPAAAFRPSAWAAALWDGNPPESLPKEDAKLAVKIDGRIEAPALLRRADRYQLARFSEWEGTAEASGRKKGRVYIYRLTPKSLQRAASQSLQIKHLLTLFSRSTERQLPPRLLEALERWENDSRTQTVFEPVILLRVASPEVLDLLRGKSTAKKYLGDNLNPTTVVVKPGGVEKLRHALAELGYLADFLDQ
jgi:hypothetical protein